VGKLKEEEGKVEFFSSTSSSFVLFLID